MSPRIVGALATLALILAAASPAAARPIDEHFEHSFTVEDGVTLHLDQTDGDVTIETWDRDEIAVEVVFQMEVKRFGFGEDPEFNVEFDQRGDHVYVTEFRKGGFSIGIQSSDRHAYRYTLMVPSYADIDIEADDGDIELAGVRGDIELVLDDGDVRLDDCFAPLVVLEGQDGDVVVQGGAGDYDLGLDDGNVRFREVAVGRLDIQVEDGDIDLELNAAGEVDWQIQTDDGNVRIDVFGPLDAEVSLRSDEENIRFDAPGADVEREEDDAVDLILGDGQGRVQIETDDGDIRFRTEATSG